MLEIPTFPYDKDGLNKWYNIFIIIKDRVYRKKVHKYVDRIVTYAFDEMTMYKVNLIGNRSFEVNTRKILRLLENTNVLKVADKTSLGYDLERIVKEKNIKGLFVKEVLKRFEKGECTEEECQKAIEIGLELM